MADARSYSLETLDYIRHQVIENIEKGEHTQQEIGDMFGITRRAVSKIYSLYKQGGIEAIKIQKRGVKKHSKGLSLEQIEEIKGKINTGTPDVYGLPYFLWTSEAVSQLIKQLTNVEYKPRYIRQLLEQWGYSVQKPVYKAYEQNKQVVETWLKEEFPAIKKQAMKEDAEIMWGDETGMRSDHQAGKSYSIKGKTPVIKRTGQRFSINMISALSNKGKLNFMITEGRINSEVFIEFLEKLIKNQRRKIILIVDGHPLHKSKILKAWLGEKKNRIEIKYLPPYSPELNPDEYLNQDIKTNILGKTRPKNKAELKELVNSFMSDRALDKKQVAKYFHAEHVRYARA